jgi:hypothetical protein
MPTIFISVDQLMSTRSSFWCKENFLKANRLHWHSKEVFRKFSKFIHPSMFLSLRDQKKSEIDYLMKGGLLRISLILIIIGDPWSMSSPWSYVRGFGTNLAQIFVIFKSCFNNFVYNVKEQTVWHASRSLANKVPAQHNPLIFIFCF